MGAPGLMAIAIILITAFLHLFVEPDSAQKEKAEQRQRESQKARKEQRQRRVRHIYTTKFEGRHCIPLRCIASIELYCIVLLAHVMFFVDLSLWVGKVCSNQSDSIVEGRLLVLRLF